jgi:hypothetical protein
MIFVGNPSRKCYPFAPTVVEGKKELKERALELDMDNLMNIAAPVKATNERVDLAISQIFPKLYLEAVLFNAPTPSGINAHGSISGSHGVGAAGLCGYVDRAGHLFGSYWLLLSDSPGHRQAKHDLHR